MKKSRFGLVGKNISYSFSRAYFSEKFKTMGLPDHSYENFDLDHIEKFRTLVAAGNLKGLNVTIPYKEVVIPFLDDLHPDAQTIGAVNTIKFTKKGLKGFNTDAYGFRKALEPHLKPYHKKALILGTGGASKAIAFVFDGLGIDFCYVSRNPDRHQLSYSVLDAKTMDSYQIIVNCSPVGTFPNTDDRPDIPYAQLTKRHLLFDLIYNPEKTAFLKAGATKGASVQNGLSMLEFQAEKAWEIWNS